MKALKACSAILVFVLCGAERTGLADERLLASHGDASLDSKLSDLLRRAGFTGSIQSKLEDRLGRRIWKDFFVLVRHWITEGAPFPCQACPEISQCRVDHHRAGDPRPVD